MAKKILVIDDDPHIVDYLATLFNDHGYETVTAAHGHEGFELLKEQRPDLITLDLDMPKEWGPKFYRRFSKDPELKDTPLIVISGLTGANLAIKKAVATVKKPFDPDELIKIVEGVIGPGPE